MHTTIDPSPEELIELAKQSRLNYHGPDSKTPLSQIHEDISHIFEVGQEHVLYCETLAVVVTDRRTVLRALHILELEDLSIRDLD